jgi:hypothetical protein
MLYHPQMSIYEVLLVISLEILRVLLLGFPGVSPLEEYTLVYTRLAAAVSFVNNDNIATI